MDSVNGSGVDASSVKVTITDERGGVLGSPNQLIDSLNSGTWTVNYVVEGVAPLGTYTVTVSAEDVLGNEAITVLGTIDLDERPTDTQFADVLPNYVISSAQTITGVVYDHDRWYGVNLALHFEEEAGSQQFHDYGRYANHATCITCPTTTTDTPFGRALDFDGVNDFLVISSTVSLDQLINDEFTIAFWIKPDSNQATTNYPNNTILTKADASGYPYIIRYKNQTNGSHGEIVVGRSDGSNSPNISSSQALNDGNFHHIAFIKEDSQLYLYIDGQLDGVTTDTTTGAITNTSRIFIGQRDNHNIGRNFGGILDELLIMDNALTADQIYQLAQDG